MRKLNSKTYKHRDGVSVINGLIDRYSPWKIVVNSFSSPEPSGSKGGLILNIPVIIVVVVVVVSPFKMFKYLLLCNHLAIHSQTSHGTSLGRGNESCFFNNF